MDSTESGFWIYDPFELLLHCSLADVKAQSNFFGGGLCLANLCGIQQTQNNIAIYLKLYYLPPGKSKSKFCFVLLLSTLWRKSGSCSLLNAPLYLLTCCFVCCLVLAGWCKVGSPLMYISGFVVISETFHITRSHLIRWYKTLITAALKKILENILVHYCQTIYILSTHQ